MLNRKTLCRSNRAMCFLCVASAAHFLFMGEFKWTFPKKSGQQDLPKNSLSRKLPTHWSLTVPQLHITKTERASRILIMSASYASCSTLHMKKFSTNKNKAINYGSLCNLWLLSLFIYFASSVYAFDTLLATYFPSETSS